jgi:hypothetical protein
MEIYRQLTTSDDSLEFWPAALRQVDQPGTVRTNFGVI